MNLLSLFTNPWMLAALAAAAVPWIIEWLFRRRKRQIELPTLVFLLDNDEQQQIKKQDRMLLLVRTIALAVLVLALTRPLIKQSWLHGVQGRNVIIFLDNTASMNQQVGVDTSFRLAQKKAADVILSLPEGASVTVGSLMDRAETISEGEKDLNAVAAKIKGLKPSAGAAPMSEGLAWLKSAIHKDDSSEIYLFSDLQSYSWKRPGAQNADDVKNYHDLAASSDLFVIDVGGATTFNYMATDLRPSDYIVTTGLAATFRATVELIGKAPDGKKAIITFLVDGEKKDVREVEASEGKPMVIEFAHHFPKAGESQVEILLEGDEHPIDNRRLYLCTVFDEVKILIVDDGAEGPNQDSFFIARAIAPATHAGMDRVSQFSTRTVNTQQFIYESLDNYSAVLFTANGAMSEQLANRIKRYVADGGSLLLFMGDAARPHDYNKFLYDGGSGPMPVALAAKSVSAPAELKLTSDHPALVTLSGLKGDQGAPISQFVPVEAKAGEESKARVVMSLADGTPIVLEHRFGKGRVMLCATSAGASWTAFPALQEFPLVVQGLIKDLVGNPDADVNLEVGQHYEQPVYISKQHLLLTYPAGNKERLIPRERSDVANAWIVSFDHTNQHGLYRFADVQPGVLGRRQFVANMNSAEGDLSRFDEKDFTATFASAATWIGPDQSIEEISGKLHTVTELAPLFLVVLTALLAIESFLAAKYGRRREAEVR
jgi:hypothetical protein